MQTIQGALTLNGNEKIAIIASRFNHFIVDRLVEGAKDAFLRHGGVEENLDIILAPGAFEIPFVLSRLLGKDSYMGVCCLGAVIRGATPHFDFVSAEATKGIANTALKYGAAVSFGVLTTDTIEQAIERAGTKAGNKGFEAMCSVIELIDLYRQLEV